MGARERIRLFRLAWDLIGSDLGSRGELYERFYLQDTYRMTALAYMLADKTRARRWSIASSRTSSDARDGRRP